MRNKETGEFELVVGDRQLLSGFFIGILLLAVVFAMGYVLGQSSPRSPKTATEAATANPPVNAPDNRPQPRKPAGNPARQPPPAGAPGRAARYGLRQSAGYCRPNRRYHPGGRSPGRSPAAAYYPARAR